RSWQMQGEVALGLDGQAEGRSLDLGTFRPGTLPNIPPDTDFGHVTVLVLSNMDIDAVPENFLRAFRSLRSLNLNNNRLLRLPPSIQHLTDLRALGLAHNRIRMDQTGIDVLAGLSRLTHLDLSYNPLGALNLRFNFVPRLSELRLRHCRLRAWPGGIEHCGLLEYADLRENQITTVPREALRMPTAYRMAFALDQNPLAVADREGLALGRGHDPMHGQPATVLQASPRSPRELWLRAGGPPERLQRWNAVSAMPDSDGLFQLLGELQGTSDFQSAHAYLEESVWMMLAAVARDSMLRTQIFDRANEARTCGDSIAGRFSELQVQVLVAEAKSAGVDDATRSNLISLGRRLFRLDRVNLVVAQEIARREIEQRGVDEVEVSLGYRVGLAEALNLPFQPRSMLYGTIANISTDQLEAAKEAVRAAETDEALVESLSQREFWRNYLELRHKDAFASFKGDIDERIGKLLETEGCKTDQQCIDEWDGLATERETLLQSLIVQLTQDALEAEKVKNS
ncbi:MAG: NEL-type E3 ubiquitin ligase domain-containing protein, partial [Pseudomonas sp.]